MISAPHMHGSLFFCPFALSFFLRSCNFVALFWFPFLFSFAFFFFFYLLLLSDSFFQLLYHFFAGLAILLLYFDFRLYFPLPFIFLIIYCCWNYYSLCDGLRFYVVYSYVKEEDVQVSIWPVCMDTHDSNCGVYPVCLHRGQHFWRNFLVKQLRDLDLKNAFVILLINLKLEPVNHVCHYLLLTLNPLPWCITFLSSSHCIWFLDPCICSLQFTR